MAYVLLDEFRTWINDSGIVDASRIVMALGGAEAIIDAFTNRSFDVVSSTDETWRHFPLENGVATLLARDHTIRTSVKSGGRVLVDGTDYVAIPPERDDEPFSALFHLGAGWSGPTDIVGRYGWSAGMSPVAPAGVRMATMLISYRLFKRRQTPYGAAESGFSQPDSLVDRDVLALLVPFQKPRYQGKKPVRLS